MSVALELDPGPGILGLDLHTSEDGGGWIVFLRGLVARGFSGVRLVISDASIRSSRGAKTSSLISSTTDASDFRRTMLPSP
jgi:Transposase, Mutator family